MSKIVGFITASEESSTKMSLLCSLHTLNSVVSNVNILLRKSKGSEKNDSFDDEVILMANSDEEDSSKGENALKR